MSAADVIGTLGFALHAAHKIYDTIQEVRKASGEIEELKAEALSVRCLLEHAGIKQAGGEHDTDVVSPDELRLQLKLSGQGEELVAAANEFIDKVTRLAGDGTRSVKTVKWLFRMSKAKELAEAFRLFHRALTDVCSINTFARVRAIPPQMLAMEQRMISAMDAMKEKIDRSIAQDREMMTDYLIRHSLTVMSHQQRGDRHQLFDELNPLCGNAEIAHGLPVRRLTHAYDNHGLASPSPYGEPGSSTTIAHTDTQVMPTSAVSQSLHTTSLPEHVPPQHSMLGPPRRCCPSDCRCRCHKWSNDYRPVPQALRSWFGDIRIPERLMASLTSSARPCDCPRCVQTRDTLSIVKCYLPKWFAQVHTEVVFQSLPVHLMIQTPRVVKSLNFIYELSYEELKIKLSTRELTVNDVEPGGGTVLHYIACMIVHDQRSDAHEMMRYMIDAGAPQDWECVGNTVTEYVTDMVTHWYGDTSAASVHLRSFEYNIARPLLHQDMEDAWERIQTKRHWSDLHYFLANPPSSPARLKTDLARILRQPSTVLYLNTRDRYGRTPLDQAIRSCPEVVDVLLLTGANPYISIASLNIAVDAQYSWRAISLLVRAGADVNKRYLPPNGAISTVLHDVIRLRSSRGPGARLPCALELVRHAGHLLDWDVRDEDGDTPLGRAKRRMEQHPGDDDVASIYKLYKTRQLPPGAQLIDRSRLGEEAEAAIHLDSMSLIEAGLAGNIQAVGELIDAGAMVNERDTSGRTLLHLVAMGIVPNGYAVALRLMRHGGWGVDWEAVTRNKLTAIQLAQETLDGLSALATVEDNQREEALNILHLLQRRALPEGVDYIYPCMRVDYCKACSARPCSGYCSNGLRMPGMFR